MATADVKNIKGETVSQVELSDSIYGVEIKKGLLHEIVVMQLASKRSGTASTKTRSEVKGSTVKLFRQKGTGRARRGDIKSPLLKGGGVSFGPSPRSYAYRPPKKVRKLALKMALSSKLQEAELTVLDSFVLERVKTKAFAESVKSLGMGTTLIITDGENRELELSSRNVPGVKLLRQEGLNVYDILKYKNLVLLESTLSYIEGRLN